MLDIRKILGTGLLVSALAMSGIAGLAVVDTTIAPESAYAATTKTNKEKAVALYNKAVKATPVAKVTKSGSNVTVHFSYKGYVETKTYGAYTFYDTLWNATSKKVKVAPGKSVKLTAPREIWVSHKDSIIKSKKTNVTYTYKNTSSKTQTVRIGVPAGSPNH